jgi:hypothetical protein
MTSRSRALGKSSNSSSSTSRAANDDSCNRLGVPASPGSSIDHPTLQAIQAATTGKLAELQHVVEEVGPGLGEDATLQLEEVSSGHFV